jgi:hypothetical protein
MRWLSTNVRREAVSGQTEKKTKLTPDFEILQQVAFSDLGKIVRTQTHELGAVNIKNIKQLRHDVHHKHNLPLHNTGGHIFDK